MRGIIILYLLYRINALAQEPLTNTNKSIHGSLKLIYSCNVCCVLNAPLQQLFHCPTFLSDQHFKCINV